MTTALPPRTEGRKTRVVCGCLEVTVRDVDAWMNAGCATAEDVCKRSGAASHCGSCVQMLTQVTGDPGGCVVDAEVEVLDPRLAKVTLRPAGGGSFSSRLRPGQHVVLSVPHAGEWVARPYTVASDAGARDARELLVRLRAEGRMGGLLASSEGVVRARVSEPRGAAFARLRARAGVVFLVAGVGVTPALSALRSKGGPPVRSVVAFLQDSDAHLERALSDACAAAGAPLRIVRSRARSERSLVNTGTAVALSAASLDDDVDVEHLARHHAGADWFLCGPPGFERMIRRQLCEGGVRERHIHVERFLVSAQDTSVPPARVRSAAERRWARVGLSLVALWLLWALLPAVPAWSGLQSHYWWRVGSGSVLAGMLAWMWVFPAMRMNGRFAMARRLEITHRVVGSLSPLALLMHQRTLGFDVLCVLSLLWVGNAALGCCDKTMIPQPARRARYAAWWLPVHVVVSMVVTALALWHVGMVLLFRGGDA